LRWSSEFLLSGGVPAGGNYIGLGITNGVFEPTNIGSGIYALKYVYNDPNGCSDSAYSNVVVDVCAGISNPLYAAINVYPNPIQNNLYLDFRQINEEVSISLINVTGELIYSEKVNNNFGDVFVINTDGFAKGLYFLSLNINGEELNYRIVKTQ